MEQTKPGATLNINYALTYVLSTGWSLFFVSFNAERVTKGSGNFQQKESGSTFFESQNIFDATLLSQYNNE